MSRNARDFSPDLEPKPEGFDTSGCWARVILAEEVVEEIETLATREGLSLRELVGHDDQSRVDYTDYSSCTYVREGFGIQLFGGNSRLQEGFGLFLRPFHRRIDWWYNGRKEVITDDIVRVPGQPFNNGSSTEDQRWNCTIEEVGNAVTSLRDEFAKDSYYEEHPNEPVILSWNEGFLRYQLQDITGLIVDRNSRNSVYFALAFRRALELNTHIYSYDMDGGRCRYVNSHDLRTEHGINTQSDRFKGLVNRYRNVYKIRLQEIKQKGLNASSEARCTCLIV